MIFFQEDYLADEVDIKKLILQTKLDSKSHFINSQLDPFCYLATNHTDYSEISNVTIICFVWMSAEEVVILDDIIVMHIVYY